MEIIVSNREQEKNYRVDYYSTLLDLKETLTVRMKLGFITQNDFGIAFDDLYFWGGNHQVDKARPISFENIKNNFILLSQQFMFQIKWGKKFKKVPFFTNKKFYHLARIVFCNFKIPKKDYKKYILSINGQIIPFENIIPFDGINDIIEITRVNSIR